MSGPTLTREQRLEMRSLIIDGGYTPTEARAWVLQFPPESEPKPTKRKKTEATR